ncbi:F-box protein CPR30-like [Chenopodium quinoa]|uniref:F-box protein CPR30-like n=1 Tax=Chenopodium quinoa TaxID=63459 RepID=UPI000B78957E|nr:F-box protein CPR30-like [Chenopodium quinoa]
MMKTKEEEEKTISPSKIGCYMPEDLITEMLLRLPVKSPVRFKSVCKDWSSIISNPSFTKTQFHLSSRYYLSLSHLIIRDDNSMFILNLDLNDIPYKKTNQHIKGKFVPLSSNFIKKTTLLDKGVRYIDVNASCNGILYVCIGKTLYLWNPTIDEYRIIPPPPNFKFPILFSGFGYASTIDDYKLVFVTRSKSAQQFCTLVYVYSTRLNKWRNIDTDFFSMCEIKINTECDYNRSAEAIISNDALHWTLEIKRCECHYIDYFDTIDHNRDNKVNFIFKFDMVNEVFERVADLKPIYSSIEENQRKIATKINATSDGSLCVYLQYIGSFGWCIEPNPGIVEMWMITKSNTQKKGKLAGRWNNIGSKYKIIRIMGNGNVIVFENRNYPNSMRNLVIFDGRQPNKRFYIEATNEYGKLYDDISCGHQRLQRVVFYSESLINPNHI